MADSDSEINGADSEDNVSYDSSSDDEGTRSLSLSGAKPEDDGDDEFNLNISFSGGYVPNTDLTRVDKGQGNP